MTDVIGELIKVQPDEAKEQAVDFVRERVDGYEPNESNLEVIAFGAVAELVAVLTTLASQTQSDIFRYFGMLANLPAEDATKASADTTWTLTADAVAEDVPHTIFEGTQIVLVGGDGEDVGFVVLEDVTVDAGDGATVVGGVAIESIEEGEDQSGLGGEAELVDDLAFVDTITVEGITTGGQDGETGDEYLIRLAQLLALTAPTPILAPDFAALVQALIPGIERATAVDLYNADTEETDVEKCVTVACVDVEGEACPSPVKAAALALLQASREFGFLVFVIDPTYSVIDVVAEVVARAGFDHDAVEASCVAALTDYLSPDAWGLPAQVSPVNGGWDNQTTVYVNELVSLLDQVAGVERVVGVELALTGDSPAAADLDLDGVAALPRPGDIAATVD